MWYGWILESLGAKPARRPLTWKACCPAHDDRVPSLSIWLGCKGALLIGCHAGCPKENVLRAAGLKYQDLFPPDDTKPERKRMERQVACYDYQDEAGRVLYQSVRFVPKTFRYRRPVGHGLWAWNLEGVRLVPYMLPQLLCPKNRDRVTFLCEGEKDVQTLAAWGLLATTNCGGTAMGWLDSYSEFLKGRRVVLLPDNDHPGRQHMDRVAGSLLRAGVGGLRVLNLPGLPDRGDVSYWADNGGTRNELVKLALAAKEWR